MKKENTFQCGTCNLIEWGLSPNEVMELSAHHFAGKHIDIDELRILKKKKKKGKGGVK